MADNRTRISVRSESIALAIRIQEAQASELTSGDVMSRLRDALSDNYRCTGKWAYVQDYIGDAESGDVIYSCDSDFFRCPYKISGGDGAAAKCIIVFDQRKDVVPRTVYEEEADEDDHYAAMESAYQRDELYDGLPLYERFISKMERDAADSEDFAGKGKSYPILKKADITAAAHALGRAGAKNLSTSTIKSRIIAIAKRKGWTSMLPKAWQDGSATTDTAKEAAKTETQPSEIKLTESTVFVEDISAIAVSESAKSPLTIKLIAPGKGSSAYYTTEVLKRDGPRVFKAGTPMALDHPTKAEEAARPEGSVKDWGAVLAKDAYWLDSRVGKDGKDSGPGLYSEIKPFSEHAQTIAEKGPYAGVSIRANGNLVMEGKKPAMREGVPLLASLNSAQGVDMVTRAGAGGMFLSESAKTAAHVTDAPAKVIEAAAVAATQGEGNMDEATVQRLIESAVTPLKTDLEATKVALTETKTALATAKAENQPLLERALQGDARVAAGEVLEGVSLRETAKTYVVAECLKSLPIKDGKLDTVAFKESVTAKAKEVAVVFGEGAGRVSGMGIAPVSIDPKEAEAKLAETKRLRESSVDVFASLMGGDKAAAEAAVNKGVAA